jgi:hypothetical protein
MMKLAQKMGQVTLKMSDRGATGRMGLSWLVHCMEHFGVKAMVPEEKKRSNRQIGFFEKMMSVVMMRAAGGERVEDVEILRKDKELVDSLGWERMAGADTALNFMKDKGNNRMMKKVNEEMVIKAMEKSEYQEFTYDHDATYIDSNKKSASYSYQKVKQFSGMTGSLAELGLINTVSFRTGSVSPSLGVLSHLRQAVEQAKEAGKRIKRFRSDSAAHQNSLFTYCDKEGIEYYVSMDKSEAMMKVVDGIEEEKWSGLTGKYEDRNDTQWAEGVYETMVGFHVRILVLRWANPDPDLFEARPYCYHVMGTNNKEIEPMEWLQVHNGRMGTIEQSHKELKGELGCEYTPSHDFEKNRGYFLLGVLAYNMIQIMKLFYLGKECLRMSVKRFRYVFVHVCGSIVKTGRKFYCNLMNVTSDVFELFRNCKSKLILYEY